MVRKPQGEGEGRVVKLGLGQIIIPHIFLLACHFHSTICIPSIFKFAFLGFFLDLYYFLGRKKRKKEIDFYQDLSMDGSEVNLRDLLLTKSLKYQNCC